MNNKEDIKRKLYDKNDELIFFVDTSKDKIKLVNQSPVKSLKLDDEFDEITDYFNQFNKYKYENKLDINETNQVSNFSNYESIKLANIIVAKRHKKLRKRNPAKINRKNTKNSEKNISKNESNNESSISDDDFSMFFNAYDNHIKTETLRQSMHKPKTSSHHTKIESSNSCKEIRLFDIISSQSRRESTTVSLKDKSLSIISQNDSIVHPVNKSKNIPLPTQSMLNIINGLREIEDEISKDQ